MPTKQHKNNTTTAATIDLAELPSDTTMYGEFGNEKDIYTYVYIKDILRMKAEMLNKKMSRSLVAYDIAVDESDKLSDMLTKIEDTLNDQLYKEGYDIRLIDDFKKDDTDVILELFESHVDDPEEKNQFIIYLPEMIFEDSDMTTDSRGYGELIRKGTVNRYASSYCSRMDRVEAKRQIIEYENNETEPKHSVAKEIVDIGVKKDKLQVYVEEIREEGMSALNNYADEFYYREDKFRAIDALFEFLGYTNLVGFKNVVREAFGYNERILKEVIHEYSKEYNRLEFNPILFNEVKPDILKDDLKLDKYVLKDVYNVLYEKDKYLILEFISQNYKSYHTNNLRKRLMEIGYIEEKTNREFVIYIKKHMDYHGISYESVDSKNIFFKR
jgi:hypothetical protein